jgi:hypothetical protein
VSKNLKKFCTSRKKKSHLDYSIHLQNPMVSDEKSKVLQNSKETLADLQI